jgi:hypothetical protein
MAVAWLLATRLVQKPSDLRGRSRLAMNRFSKFAWQGVFCLIAIASLASLTVSAASFSWWNRDASYLNHKIAEVINRTKNPIVISEVGEDHTNPGDLLSISYLAKQDIPFLGLTPSFQMVETPKFTQQIQGKTALVFRPSQSLKRLLESKFGSLTYVRSVEWLWQIPAIEPRQS